MKIKVTGIEWDNSEFVGEDELDSDLCLNNLPSEVIIDADYELDVDDICSWLSDEYGFCVEGFANVEYEDETVKDLDGMVCGNGSEFCIG